MMLAVRQERGERGECSLAAFVTLQVATVLLKKFFGSNLENIDFKNTAHTCKKL